MMNSNDSNAGVGNTKPPPKQVVPSKYWVFTLNNYSELEVSNLVTIFGENNIDYVFGKEVGESGTPHLQGYFESKTKCRPLGLFKDSILKGRFHFEKRKGKREQAYEYCLKDGDVTCNFTVGKKPVKILKDSDLLKWELEILDILKEEPDDRRIYWFHDDDKCGTGKTTFCKYLVVKYDALVLGGKSADMKNGIINYTIKNGDTPSLILVNLPRTFNKDYLSYTGIEECKDMMFYSGKYEGGMVCGNCPHLIIFSNELPDMDAMDGSRWKVYNIINGAYEE